MATEAAPAGLSKKTVIIWAITIILPLAIMLIPTNEVFNIKLKLYVAITLMGILIMAFESLNQLALAILLPVAYIVFQLAPANVVFSSWLSYIPWMMVGGLLLAEVLNGIGLLDRVAYKCIILTGGTYLGILAGIALAGVVMFIFIPGQTMIIMATLGYGICVALDLGRSRASAGIMLTAAVATALPQHFIYSPNYLIYFPLGESATGPLSIGWLEFFGKNWPTLFFFLLMLALAYIMFKPRKGEAAINGADYFKAEYEKLGPMSMAEKKGAFLCVLLLLLVMFGKRLGFEPAWAFAFVPMLAFVPGINIAKMEDVQRVRFSFVFFMTACLAIGATAGALGLGTLLTQLAVPIISGMPASTFLVVAYLFIFVFNFLLTPMAIMAAFTLPLVQMAMSLGINPKAFYMFMMQSADQIVLPYENIQYLIFASFGMISAKDFAKYMGLKTVLNVAFFFLILIPFWKLIGFFYM